MAVACSKVMPMPIAWGKMRVEARIQPRTASAGLYQGPGDLQVAGIRDNMTLHHQN